MNTITRALAVLALVALPAAAAQEAASARPTAERPVVVAHGGASGYLPEDTMAAFALAIQMGADFIEPTVYLTSDGVLVARHQRSLDATTNVREVAMRSPLFAPHLRGGEYLVDQLPYERLRELAALPRGGHELASIGNGYLRGGEGFGIPTLRQVLDYVHVLYRLTGRMVGVYVQLGSVEGFAAAGYNTAVADAAALALADPRYGGLFDGSQGNVFLHTADPDIARRLRAVTRVPAIERASCSDPWWDGGMAPGTSRGIAVSRNDVATDPGCVARAHAGGLLVHVHLLAADFVDHSLLHALGVDGIVTAHPDVAKKARDVYYPLVPGELDEAAGSWSAATSGGVAGMRLSVANAFGGRATGLPFHTVHEFALFRLPVCMEAGSERVAHSALALEVVSAGADAQRSHWFLGWVMPESVAGECFLAAVTLKDDTRIERRFRAVR